MKHLGTVVLIIGLLVVMLPAFAVGFVISAITSGFATGWNKQIELRETLEGGLS